MLFFAVLGSVCTIGLFFITGMWYVLGGVIFILANVAFGASIVFYNAFLPEIASEDQRDKVSSRGWALGYIGGGTLLLLNLILYQLRDSDRPGCRHGGAHQHGFGWSVVAGLWLPRHSAVARTRHAAPIAGRRDLSEDRLQAIGTNAARDSQIPDDAALPHRLSVVQRRRANRHRRVGVVRRARVGHGVQQT